MGSMRSDPRSAVFFGLRSCGFCRWTLLQVRQEKHESGRGHAVQTRGLAETCRLLALELLSELVGKAGQGVIGEARGDRDRLVLS